MSERNKYLEMDGLYWESETHEWFKDNSNTSYAQKKSNLYGGTTADDSLNLMCFVVREKVTGEYNRLIMDITFNQIIYHSKSLEDIGFFIDKLKIEKRFADKHKLF
jgi:hypothetical protein